MAITFREVMLMHYYNMSNELSAQGIQSQYEDMVDMALVWLSWEMKTGHPNEFSSKYEKLKFSRLDDLKIDSPEKKYRRIVAKLELLAEVLAKHNINLSGREMKNYDLDPEGEPDFSTIIPGFSSQKGTGGGGFDGLSDDSSEKD